MSTAPSPNRIARSDDLALTPYHGESAGQRHPATALNPMDRIQQINYEKDFQIAFLQSKGDGFQRLFEKLMSKAHPNDFMACRPWGNVGDRKNDGYLPSARTLFQSYAPNELSAAEAIKKINEDFEGAKEHWEKYFDEWTFVHNAPDGRLGPHIIEVLVKLAQANPKIKIGHCGYEEMLAKFRQLSLQDLESWFGRSLTMEANVNLGYSDLMAVLTHIKRRSRAGDERSKGRVAREDRSKPSIACRRRIPEDRHAEVAARYAVLQHLEESGLRRANCLGIQE